MVVITVTIHIKPQISDIPFQKKDGTMTNYTHTEAKIDPNGISVEITTCQPTCS